MIPILIVCYNNYKYVDNTVQQIIKINQDYEPYITIIDNQSDDEETKYYLKTTKTNVYYNVRNVGPWIRNDVNSDIYNAMPSKFILTDPDLEFNPNIPKNFVEILIQISDKYAGFKTGFALDISDFSEMYQCEYLQGKTIYQWEEGFYSNKIEDYEGYPIYRADIDTTFAVINKNNNGPNIRVGGSFIAKHLPWYPKNKIYNEYENYCQSLKQKSYSTIRRVILQMTESKYQKYNINNQIILIPYYLNHVYSEKISNSLNNQILLSFFDKYLRKNKTMIDIGAWMGLQSIYASNISEKVYSIEPDKESFRHLENTICIYNKNIIPIQKFLQTSKGARVFIGKKEGTNLGDGNSILIKNLESMIENLHFHSVETTDINSLLEENNIKPFDISLIHIDINGEEENCLESIYTLCKKYNLPLIVKIYYSEWKNKNLNRFKFLNLLLRTKIEKLQTTYIEFENINQHIVIKKKGQKLYLPKDFKNKNLDFWINHYPKWEENNFNQIQPFLDKNKTFINIGAWIGTAALYMSHFSKKVIAVEPDRDAFIDLQKNALINNNNIECVNKAFYHISNIEVPFGRNRFLNNSVLNDSTSHIYNEETEESYKVTTINLKSMLENYDLKPEEISIIKICIEGGEEYIIEQVIDFHKKYKVPIHLSTRFDWWNDKNIHRFSFLSEDIKQSLLDKSILLSYPNRFDQIFKRDVLFYIRKNQMDKNYSFWIKHYYNWENYTFDVLDNNLDKNKIYINIGAWIGTTAIYASKKSKHVYALEADKYSFYDLVDNCNHNSRNITCINKAIYYKSNENIFFGKNKFMKNSSLNDSTSHIYDDRFEQVEGLDSFYVETITLTDLIESNSINYSEISLIKVDIEGGEEFILHDILKLVKEKNLKIYVSFHLDWWSNKDLSRFDLTTEQINWINNNPFGAYLFTT